MMKKLLCLLFAFTAAMNLTACGSENSTEAVTQTEAAKGAVTENATTQAAKPDAEQEKALVVYFSQPEATDADNMTEDEENSVVLIDGEMLGNTQYVAYAIQENTGSDIWRIEPETPYPTDHDALVQQASKEQEQDIRPTLKGEIVNFNDYSTVYVGYPIWWSDMPMVMYAFLEIYDFSGKTIIPFSTHGGSGLAGTVSQIVELEPDATVYEDVLSISRDDVQDARQQIDNWLNSINE